MKECCEKWKKQKDYVLWEFIHFNNRTSRQEMIANSTYCPGCGERLEMTKEQREVINECML